MPTVELEQALQAAKWGTAEKDSIEVISRILDLPRELVVRVYFACTQISVLRRKFENVDYEHEIPQEVRDAIVDQLKRGATRIHVRTAIQNDLSMLAPVPALTKVATDVCRGCRYWQECVSQNLSTPERCFKSGPPATIRDYHGDGKPQIARYSRGGTLVKPLRIRGDHVSVQCTQPPGTFDITVDDLWSED